MKKINNKILVTVLVGLAVVFALSRVFRSSRLQSNLRTELLSIDTASVTKVLLYPAVEKSKELQLTRDGKKWNVKLDNRTAVAEQGSVNNALNTFIKLKPLRLVTKKKEKWGEYSVADSGTRVKVFKGEEVVADVHVGRIGFNQPTDGQFNPNGVFTYVRLTNEDEVYAVEGFLESSFNRSYNDWRDKAFLRLKKELVTELQFNYPADSSFVVTKKDKGWWIGSEQADSLKVNSFLSQLEFKNANAFADDFSPISSANVVIQIKGVSGSLATVEGWKRPTDWALKSSWQSTIYFSSENTGLVKTLFEAKKNLLLKK
jgi:Domain of unknown function (DUF4340)